MSVITPLSFLNASSGEEVVHRDVPDSTSQQLQQLLSQQKADLVSFWDIWTRLYITNLPPVVKNHKAGVTLQVGDLVLLNDQQLKRLHWPLAKVTKLLPGTDSKVRSVEIRTASSILQRPIKLLYRLELPPQAFQWDNDSASVDEDPPVAEPDDTDK